MPSALGLKQTHSKTSSTPDSARYLAIGRLLVTLTALLVVAGAIYGTELAPTVPDNRAVAETTRLRATIAAIADDLGDGDSVELSMAWQDLHNDLESVARDLERPSPSVDVDGVIARVDKFREQFDPENETDNTSWDELVEALRALSRPSDE